MFTKVSIFVDTALKRCLEENPMLAVGYCALQRSLSVVLEVGLTRKRYSGKDQLEFIQFDWQSYKVDFETFCDRINSSLRGNLTNRIEAVIRKGTEEQYLLMDVDFFTARRDVATTGEKKGLVMNLTFVLDLVNNRTSLTSWRFF